MSNIVDRLTTEDKDVLCAMSDAGGQRQAGEIENKVPHLDRRAIHYRLNKLEEMGLLDRQKQGDDRMAPVLYTLSDLGADVAQDVVYDHETVRDELQHLREQHRQLIEAVSHLQDTYNELEEQVEEMDVYVQKNATDIQGVKRFLDDRFDVS